MDLGEYMDILSESTHCSRGSEKLSDQNDWFSGGQSACVLCHSRACANTSWTEERHGGLLSPKLTRMSLIEVLIYGDRILHTTAIFDCKQKARYFSSRKCIDLRTTCNQWWAMCRFDKTKVRKWFCKGEREVGKGYYRISPLMLSDQCGVREHPLLTFLFYFRWSFYLLIFYTPQKGVHFI